MVPMKITLWFFHHSLILTWRSMCNCWGICITIGCLGCLSEVLLMTPQRPSRDPRRSPCCPQVSTTTSSERRAPREGTICYRGAGGNRERMVRNFSSIDFHFYQIQCCHKLPCQIWSWMHIWRMLNFRIFVNQLKKYSKFGINFWQHFLTFNRADTPSQVISSNNFSQSKTYGEYSAQHLRVMPFDEI